MAYRKGGGMGMGEEKEGLGHGGKVGEMNNALVVH
jgi:hypothetical protein